MAIKAPPLGKMKNVSIPSQNVEWDPRSKTIADGIQRNVIPTGVNDLEGHTIAIGTTSMFGSGIFIRTEVGATDYDGISYTDIGGKSTDGLTNKVEASPKLAYGNVSIGFKF